jgi:hypothetical protein
MTKIPIGVIGHVLNEGVPEPYIAVQDDREVTGGYLIFMSATPGLRGLIYDDWVLAEALEAYFEGRGWQVEWSPDPLPEE